MTQLPPADDDLIRALLNYERPWSRAEAEQDPSRIARSEWSSKVPRVTPAVQKEIKRLKEKVVIYSRQHGSTWHTIEFFANEANIGALAAAMKVWGEEFPGDLKAAYSYRGQEELVERVQSKTGMGGYQVGGGRPEAPPEYCPTTLWVSRKRAPPTEIVSDPRELWELGHEFKFSDEGDEDMKEYATTFALTKLSLD
ncbi:hypothetical protein PG993_006956 [Apiospora rasikravindrae]|uniref:Uncharacterized protein n=1 Tax=Apiospora rasikravindrae TaxID=990691 RepID=A0ABR1SW49_9PEZI